MRRREVLALGVLLAGCTAAVDSITFDRGQFAITFTKLVQIGLDLLNGAISKNTSKTGVPNAYAVQLGRFRDNILAVQKDVERQIAEAPQKKQQVDMQGIAEVVGVLAQAIPVILPLLVAAA